MMKFSSITLNILIVILIAGCGQVVYRVNPDLSPKMGIREAKDAIELSLSLAKKSPDIKGITFKGDEFIVETIDRRFGFTSGYDDVSRRVIAIGSAFGVHIKLFGGHGHQAVSLYWKSEEDARLFVDAVHALRKGLLGREQVKTEVATLPPSSSQNDTSRQTLKQRETSPHIKGDAPDLVKGATVPTTQPDASLTTSPPPVAAEKTPPKIIITTPDVTHSLKVVTRQPSITIAGVAESKNGIVEVMVNGFPSNLTENGIFTSEVLLKVGQNTIVVTALDTQRNKTTNHFIIQREKGSDMATMKLPNITSVDKTPARITITSPDTSRSLKVIARQSSVTVTGVAKSTSGIAEVIVNGMPAELDESGNFSRDTLLKVGQNTIVVAATDIYGNKTTHHFAVHREAGKVMQAKREDASPPAVSKLPFANYHALFIAVQDYDSRDIGKLDYAVSDARRLRDTLVSTYTFEKENTIILENPDRRTIYKTLQGLRNKLTEHDNLLIFYAGHGYWQEDMKQGFWLPRDASGINDPSDWIPNSTVRDYIKAIRVKHLLLIADACFSGGIFKVRDAFQKQQASIEKIYELPSRKAVTSGAMKTVPDHSVFLEYLIKRLKENNEAYLDTQKLFTNLREAVINNSPTHQTPLYGAISEAGDEGGDFIFVKRP